MMRREKIDVALDGGESHDWSRLIVFDVPVYLLAATTNTIDAIPSDPDGYIIDYSQLTANSTVPEPTTMILLGVGLLGVVVIRRRF